jgi:NADH-quinone oxidoreductase subunit L
MLVSTMIVAAGIGLGWRLYGQATEADPLETRWPGMFRVLRDRFYVDELYERSVLRWHDEFARFCRRLDEVVFEGAVRAVYRPGAGFGLVEPVDGRVCGESGI